MPLSTWPTVFLILLHIFNSIIAISHFISLTILTLSVHSWWFTACDFLPFIYALKYSTAFYFKGLQGTQMNLAETYSSWEKISYKSTIQANTVCLRMNRAFKLYRQHVCLDSTNHEEAKNPCRNTGCFSAGSSKCFNFCIPLRAIPRRICHREVLYSGFFNELKHFHTYFSPPLVWEDFH